jgi:hypothetical protein
MKAPCPQLTVRVLTVATPLLKHHGLSMQQAANLSETNITMAVITLHVNGTYTPQVSSPSKADPTLSKPFVPCMHDTMPRPPCYTMRSRLQYVRSAGPADGYSECNDSRTGQTRRPYDSHSQNSICTGAQSLQTGDDLPEALALLCCTRNHVLCYMTQFSMHLSNSADAGR